MASSHRVTDLEKNSFRISKDEAPTPFCVLSFHNRLDLIREPAFYWVFDFPNLSLFVSSYVKMKKFSWFQFNRLAISWPPWVRVWGWASYRFLPFTVFSHDLSFCFSSYIVHLQCTSEGGSLDV